MRHPDNKECRPCRVQRQRRESTVYPGYLVRAHNGKPRAEHRLIAEAALGRPLKRTEIVHHINMDKRDNRHRNLLICTKDYHKELHHRMEMATARRIRVWQDTQGA